MNNHSLLDNHIYFFWGEGGLRNTGKITIKSSNSPGFDQRNKGVFFKCIFISLYFHYRIGLHITRIYNSYFLVLICITRIR